MSARKIRVAELFAGVGGFRLALDGYSKKVQPELTMPSAGPFKTVWANQWEPPGTEAKQFAWRCYENRFGTNSCVNRDIASVLDDYQKGIVDIPDVDMVVGGFPCQDYSVAKPLSKAEGIKGIKGVLWWELFRFIQLKQPKFILLENVDRLLKSPVGQRGKDFAVILSCLASEGYSIEWRVINAADYGMPQKRRRVFLFGVKTDEEWSLEDRVLGSGVLAEAFPVEERVEAVSSGEIALDPYAVSKSFGKGCKHSVFQNAGAMQASRYYTGKTRPSYDGPLSTLGP